MSKKVTNKIEIVVDGYDVTNIDVLTTRFERKQGQYFIFGDEVSQDHFRSVLKNLWSRPEHNFNLNGKLDASNIEGGLDFLDLWFETLDDPKLDKLKEVVWKGAMQYPQVNPLPSDEWDAMVGKCKDAYTKWQMDEQRKWLTKFMKLYVDCLPKPGEFDVLKYSPPFCLWCIDDGPCNCASYGPTHLTDKYGIIQQRVLLRGKFRKCVTDLHTDFCKLVGGDKHKDLLKKLIEIRELAREKRMRLKTARKNVMVLYDKFMSAEFEPLQKRWNQIVKFVSWYRLTKHEVQHHPWKEGDPKAVGRMQSLFKDIYFNLMHPGNFRTVAMTMFGHYTAIRAFDIFRRQLTVAFSSLNTITIFPCPTLADPAALKSLCHTCYKTAAPGSKLKRCSKCKVANYCGVDCAMMSWPLHKKDCSEQLKRMQDDSLPKTK